MHFLHRLLPAALAPFFIASSVFAASAPSQRATLGLPVQLSSGHEVVPFHPETTFKTYGDGINHPLSSRAQFSLQDAAVAFATTLLSPNQVGQGVIYKSGYAGEVSQYAYLAQTHDGVPISNAVANVAFNSAGQVVAHGSSFVTPNYFTESVPNVTPQSVITPVQIALNATYNNSPIALEYFVNSNNSAHLVYVFQVQNSTTGAWYEVFADATTRALLSVIDYVSKATYQALPIQKQVLTQGFEMIVNPEDATASPLGWHNDGTSNYTTTEGNNVCSWKGTESSTSSQSASPLVFSYTQNPSLAPTAQVNVDAARVNAFYVANVFHDYTYRYGFTEAAFNFQTNNHGLSGSGNDSVSISVQDSAGVDSADFASPAEGTSGLLRLFIWNDTTPNRDGSLENDIVMHELTHGLTNRLTGGGTARCLKTIESLGMGEGFSDAMANWNEKNSSATPDFVIGQYVSNNPAGIRSYPYSTSLTTNPLLYSALQTRTEPHSSGEIWANMLYQVYAGLVAAHGWSATARTNPSGTEGNIVWLHLFIDALALQPCSPTFVTGRDAWIQADVNRYAGVNSCTIWKAFASRGLGVNAANHVDDFTVPATCS